MTVWLIPAVVLGLGLWLIVVGAVPARASLGEELARLRLLPPEPPPLRSAARSRPSPLVAAGTPLARALLRRPGAITLRLLGGLVSPEDLAVMGQSLERHVAEKLATALLGFLLPLCAGGLLLDAGGLVGVNLSLGIAVPLWFAVLLGLSGFIAPDLVLRTNAASRRRELLEDLSVFIQAVGMSLTANRGVEAALQDAVAVGDDWGFAQLRGALAQSRIGSDRPWAALGRLGQELGVDTLEELGARVALAGEDGARIADSLATFAETLRSRRLIQVEREENVRSEVMAAVSVLPLVAFTLFLVAPAFFQLLSGHG
jgi:Flp pilus assembly protein TadB